MVSSNRLITIAQIGAPHGVQGYLKLRVFTQDPQSITRFQVWYIQLNKEWQLLERYELQRKGDQYYIRIDDVCDRDQAKRFTHALIAVSREELPDINDPDEYYWSDLEGLTVINTQGEILGTVDHLFETGANDVMSVIGQKHHLIPFIKNYVINVDLEQRQILVDWQQDF